MVHIGRRNALKAMLGIALGATPLALALPPSKKGDEGDKKEAGSAYNNDKEPMPWQNLEDGLRFAQVFPKKRSIHGDSALRVLSIDPERYDIRLLTAHEQGYKARTAEEWGEEFGLLAVTNAGMFHRDGTNTGYMRNSSVVNNPDMRKDYRSFLALHPSRSGMPLAQIVEADCQQGIEATISNYRIVIQGLRMIDCKGNNRWALQPKLWSQAALAIDKDGHVLFLHSRSPYTVHQFNENVRQLPLRVQNMMYLEGGPEASLYVNAGGREVRQIGSYETGFNEDDDNKVFWEIPNVLGVVRKEGVK